jgi:hypothetical protein
MTWGRVARDKWRWSSGFSSWNYCNLGIMEHQELPKYQWNSMKKAVYNSVVRSKKKSRFWRLGVPSCKKSIYKVTWRITVIRKTLISSDVNHCKFKIWDWFSLWEPGASSKFSPSKIKISFFHTAGKDIIFY